MGTLATRLKQLRLQALLTQEEIEARLRKRFGHLTDEEIAKTAKGLVSHEAGLTQAELAERTKQVKPSGLDRTMIGKIERHQRRNPSLATLNVLAKALSLGLGPAVLIDDLVTNPTTNKEKPSTLLRRITVKVETIEDPETLQDILNYIEFKRR